MKESENDICANCCLKQNCRSFFCVNYTPEALEVEELDEDELDSLNKIDEIIIKPGGNYEKIQT